MVKYKACQHYSFLLIGFGKLSPATGSKIENMGCCNTKQRKPKVRNVAKKSVQEYNHSQRASLQNKDNCQQYVNDEYEQSSFDNQSYSK